MDVESQTPITATEVLHQLQDVEEPNPVQRDTVEFLTRNIAVHDPDTLQELWDEVEAVDSFRDEHIIKIIETLPRSEQEVRTLFSKERIKLDDSDIEQVVDFSESVGTR